jgi:hypothetical protein
MPQLSKALRSQLKRNESKNLLHAQVEQLLEIDPTFLAALEELLAGAKANPANFNLDEIAADAASSFIDKIYAINQFIQVDNSAKQSLKQIYIESWQKLSETRDIESTLRNHHYPRISEFLAKLYPQALAEAIQFSPTLNRVPCSEYSAELQIRLFRLDLSTMHQPVLDIGCGSQANLVTYLRSRHIEAFGMDRIIRQKADYLMETDWFEMQLGSNKWGTILSNLSFANHLVYTQRYEPNHVPRYLKKYHEILDSLIAGGAFIYAPGVESLEGQTMPEKFHTEKWAISPQHIVTRVKKSP